MRELDAQIILWPLYVDYSIAGWEAKIKEEYAQRVKALPAPVLMINSYVSDENRSKGGCAVFRNGRIQQELPMGTIGVLPVEFR